MKGASIIVTNLRFALLLAACIGLPHVGHAADQSPPLSTIAGHVRYESATIDDVKVFYREAGSKNAPAIPLLHGLPTSSQMIRELITRLADKYHVIAPGYPGFGFSDMPDRSKLLARSRISAICHTRRFT